MKRPCGISDAMDILSLRKVSGDLAMSFALKHTERLGKSSLMATGQNQTGANA
jgi:hypothetical protein